MTNINNPQHIINGTPDFSVYDGDFDKYNKSVRPTDLDLMVEIKGYFLMHEYKFEKSPITKGQEILQDQLLAKNFTIVNVWHRGPCLDMNLIAAEFKTPLCFPMPEYGHYHFYEEADTLDKIKSFHVWWTGYALHAIRNPK